MSSKMKKCKPKKRVKLKKRKHVCWGVQGGAEVFCGTCGKVMYA